MAKVYTLTPKESARLQRALAGCLVNPFVDDILDFNWEAVWHYCKGLEIPDPLSRTRRKNLYDAIDPTTLIGWSLKTQQITCAVSACRSYSVVIARADIFGRGDRLGFPGIGRASAPAELGRAILKVWRDKIELDRRTQGVRESRVATLLKPPKRTEFAVHETDLEIYEEANLKWVWADGAKGLWGIEKKSDRRVYRWYPSGGQLFEEFQVPKEIMTLQLRWRRLDPDRLFTKLEELAGQALENLVDEGRKS